MKVKKLLSTIAAIAIAATSFAGLGITANAATETVNETFATASANKTEFTTNYTSWGIDGSNINATVSDNALSLQSINTNNNNYISYQIDTLANVANKVYKLSFNEKTSTGSNTKNNASEVGVVASDSSALTWQTSGYTVFKTADIGMTDTAKTYAVDLVVNNVSKTITWVVDGVVKKTSTTKTDVNRLVLRPGRNQTDVLSNFKVYELSMPTLSFDKDTVTLDIASTSVTKSDDVTATLSADTEIKSAVSSDADVASVGFDGTKITITGGTKAGDATITVTAAKTGTGADTFETVTKTIAVTVNDSSATACDLTLNYVDSTDTTKVLKSAKTSADAFVNVAYELTETEKTDFEYTDKDTGIVYTAKVTTTSVTPDAATDTCNVLCTLTENTYAATITTAPYAKVVLSGTTKSGAEYAGETIYSDSTGKATATLKQGTYNAAVTKDGYNANATNALEVTTAGGSATANLTTADINVLFTEDFATTGFANKEAGLYGVVSPDNKGAYMRLLNGACQQVNPASGSRSATMTFVYPTQVADVYGMDFDVDIAYSTYAGDTTIKAGDVTLVSSSASVKGKVSVVYDKANGKVTSTLSVADADDVVLATDYTGTMFTSLTLNAIRGVNITVDNIVIKKLPSIQSVTTNETEVTAPTNVKVAKDDTEVTYASLTDGKTVTTICVKVANAVAGTAPTVNVTIGDKPETAVATKLTTANTDGTFIYQIVADSAATVTGVTYGTASWTPTAE